MAKPKAESPKPKTCDYCGSERMDWVKCKLICRDCPVRATCLDWALASGQEAGIWGGLTEDERRRLRRGRGFRPAADPRSEEWS